MGSKRAYDALMALSGGLQTVANYRGAKQEKEEERAYQKERDEANQRFSMTMAEKQMAHSSSENQLTREHQSSESELSRKQAMEIYRMQEGAATARHNSSMAASARQFAAAEKRAIAAEGRQAVQDKLRIHELGFTSAAGQYNAVVKAQEEALAEIDKNERLTRQADKDAAKAAIKQQYEIPLAKARTQMDASFGKMEVAVGLKKEPAGKVEVGPMQFGDPTEPGAAAAPSAGGAAGVGQAGAPGGGAPGEGPVNSAKVDAAVNAALAQLRASGEAPPSEKTLAAGFFESGMSRQDAVMAARKVLQQSSRGQ